MSSKKNNVEAIYPLTSPQRAMLFHSLAPGQVDNGLVQVHFRLQGRLDVARLKNAWHQVVHRHEALRMSIHPRNDKESLIVVRSSVDIVWRHEDWRLLDAEVQTKRLDQFLQDDRERGFDLANCPVMRLGLLRFGDRESLHVWTCHHLFLDGWSAVAAIQRVLSAYDAPEANSRSESGQPEMRYGSYLAWRKNQDSKAAERFWRDKLQGFREPTRLPLIDNGPTTRRHALQEYQPAFDTRLSKRIVAAARELQVTPTSLVQAAWALVLAGNSGQNDVLFGVVVSGRNVEIPGLASAIGSFANVVCRRIQLASQEAVGDLVRRVKSEQFEMQPFEHIALSDVQPWSDVSGKQRLFHSLLAVENFPWGDFDAHAYGDLRLSEFQGGITTTYPLTLVIAPGRAALLKCIFDKARISDKNVRRMIDQFSSALQVLVTESTRPTQGVLSIIRQVSSARAIASTNDPVERAKPAPAESQPKSPAIQPRTASERQLASIWQDVLGLESVSIGDNFFALGGASLSSVRVIEQAAEKGLKITPQMFYEDASLEGMARAAVARQSPPSATPNGAQSATTESTVGPSPQLVQDDSDRAKVVRLSPGEQGPPLFLVSIDGLYAHVYRTLVERMENYTCHTLVWEQSHDDSLPSDRVPVTKTAAEFLQRIREIQPQGPYLLAGMCNGAFVAWEIACLLSDAGGEVGFLGMIATANPRESAFKPFHQRLMIRLRGLRNLDEGVPLRQRIGPLAVRATRWAGRFTRSLAPGQAHLRRGMRRDTFEFVPRPFPGRVTIFRASEGSEQFDYETDARLGWDKLAGSLDLIEIPSFAYNILESPAVDILAERMQSAIEAGDGKS